MENLKRTSRIIKLILFLIHIYICVFVVLQWSYSVGFDIDSALNMQVAQNLSETFIYKPSLMPERIYYHYITTNGPIQYLAAFFINLTGSIHTASAMTSMIVLLSVGTVLLVCSPIVYLTYILFMFIGNYWVLHLTLYGEPIALLFLILGFIFMKKWKDEGVDTTKSFFVISFLFSLAISSKFISIAIIPFILFLFWDFKKSKSLIVLIKFYILSFIMWGFQILASIAHSEILTEEKTRFYTSFCEPIIKFIMYHFGHGVQVLKDDQSEPFWFPSISLNIALVLLIGLIVKRSPRAIPFVLITIIFRSVLNFNDRRIFLCIALLVLYGVYIFTKERILNFKKMGISIRGLSGLTLFLLLISNIRSDIYTDYFTKKWYGFQNIEKNSPYFTNKNIIHEYVLSKPGMEVAVLQGYHSIAKLGLKMGPIRPFYEAKFDNLVDKVEDLKSKKKYFMIHSYYYKKFLLEEEGARIIVEDNDVYFCMF